MEGVAAADSVTRTGRSASAVAFFSSSGSSGSGASGESGPNEASCCSGVPFGLCSSRVESAGASGSVSIAEILNVGWKDVS